MYRLTPRMLQNFRASLSEYHKIFDGGRCDSWQQEELIVKAIKSDTQTQHQVFWKEKGHDDKEDMRVRTNGTVHQLQIKSGQIKKDRAGRELLTLSGHRLGRFGGVMDDISTYINSRTAQILAVPYRCVDGEEGRQHKYTVSYIDASLLAETNADRWEVKGKNTHYQVSERGVQYRISPTIELANMVEDTD